MFGPFQRKVAPPHSWTIPVPCDRIADLLLTFLVWHSRLRPHILVESE